MGELTLEELASKLNSIHKTASAVKADVEEIKQRDHPLHQAMDEKHDDEKTAMDEEHKESMDEEHKEAMDEEHEKEARKARYKAMKKAMDEHDEKDRDTAMHKAMDNNDVKHHQTNPTENTTRNDKEKTAMDEEHEEEHAAVASIIGDKREEFINKILSANKVFNAPNIKSVEKRVRKASLTKLKAEYNIIKPFTAAAQPTQTATEQPEQVIPYFANIMNPEQVDASQLNASSPDSAFAQISTKELLEMAN